MNENISEGGKEFLRNAIKAGALVSDGPVPADFKKGWAHPPFMRGMKAHYWTRDMDLEDGAFGVISACGLSTVSTAQVPLLKPGNLPYCGRCDTKLLGKIR